MSRALLDVDVLLTPLDADHVGHGRAVAWLDASVIDRERAHGPRQVTDAYLLALAVAHDGRLVTFDRSIALSAVHGATDAHVVIP